MSFVGTALNFVYNKKELIIAIVLITIGKLLIIK